MSVECQPSASPEAPLLLALDRHRNQRNANTLQKLAEAGLEPGDVSVASARNLRKSPSPSGAECGALGAQLAEIPHDLQVVVDAWPTLPEAVRANVVAIVEKAEAARG